MSGRAAPRAGAGFSQHWANRNNSGLVFPEKTDTAPAATAFFAACNDASETVSPGASNQITRRAESSGGICSRRVVGNLFRLEIARPVVRNIVQRNQIGVEIHAHGPIDRRLLAALGVIDTPAALSALSMRNGEFTLPPNCSWAVL